MRVKRSEHEHRVLCRPDETEVPAHHQNGVEGAEARIDGGKRKEANILHSSPPAHLDRSGRDVDRHDAEPAPLRLEAVPPGSTADVENAPAHELEDLLLPGGPTTFNGPKEPHHAPFRRQFMPTFGGGCRNYCLLEVWIGPDASVPARDAAERIVASLTAPP